MRSFLPLVLTALSSVASAAPTENDRRTAPFVPVLEYPPNWSSKTCTDAGNVWAGKTLEYRDLFADVPADLEERDDTNTTDVSSSFKSVDYFFQDDQGLARSLEKRQPFCHRLGRMYFRVPGNYHNTHTVTLDAGYQYILSFGVDAIVTSIAVYANPNIPQLWEVIARENFNSRAGTMVLDVVRTVTMHFYIKFSGDPGTVNGELGLFRLNLPNGVHIRK